jgi:hypothetical protein
MNSLQQLLESKTRPKQNGYRVNNELWKYFPSKFVELPKHPGMILSNVDRFLISNGHVRHCYVSKLRGIEELEVSMRWFKDVVTHAFQHHVMVQFILLYLFEQKTLVLHCYVR